LYLVLGAGILPKEVVSNKKILNCHPGIIPIARGLDAFKWSILELKPLGVTLHFLTEKVDYGPIIARIRTPIFESDSLESLARRHYELEIKVMSNFYKYLEKPVDDFKEQELEEAPPKKRMSFEQEIKMISNFSKYKKMYAFKGGF
jgi:phosphoribosylglycinamide formyltransferase-1